jgi:hypothetical protein
MPETERRDRYDLIGPIVERLAGGGGGGVGPTGSVPFVLQLAGGPARPPVRPKASPTAVWTITPPDDAAKARDAVLKARDAVDEAWKAAREVADRIAGRSSRIWYWRAPGTTVAEACRDRCRDLAEMERLLCAMQWRLSEYFVEVRRAATLPKLVTDCPDAPQDCCGDDVMEDPIPLPCDEWGEWAGIRAEQLAQRNDTAAQRVELAQQASEIARQGTLVVTLVADVQALRDATARNEVLLERIAAGLRPAAAAEATAQAAPGPATQAAPDVASGTEAAPPPQEPEPEPDPSQRRRGARGA